MKKYENGYNDKISYYQYKVNQAIENLDTKDLAYYSGKLSYFMERQRELNRKTMIFGILPA
jgi:hypothetical protein